MPKMCVFQVAGGPVPISVNPTLVRVLKEWSPTITMIEFDKAHHISIALPIEQVRTMLDKAMNEH